MKITRASQYYFRVETINTAFFFKNRMATRGSIRDHTPFEVVNIRKLEIKQLHMLGCTKFVYNPKENMEAEFYLRLKLLTINGYDKGDEYTVTLSKSSNVPKFSNVPFVESVERAPKPTKPFVESDLHGDNIKFPESS